jgi:hypothetical protein
MSDMSPELERYINLTGNLITITMGIIAAASYLHKRHSKASNNLPSSQPAIKKNEKWLRAKFERVSPPTPNLQKKPESVPRGISKIFELLFLSDITTGSDIGG